MTYAQIRSGRKLHLVYEAGEGPPGGPLIPAGSVSTPLCGHPVPGGYRMTINAPLANACKRCQRVWRARHGKGKK